MDLSKKNRFSAEEEKNYIPHTEKRKKVPAGEMIEFLIFLWNTWILCKYFVLLDASNSQRAPS